MATITRTLSTTPPPRFFDAQEERALHDVTARLERVMSALEAKRPRRH